MTVLNEFPANAVLPDGTRAAQARVAAVDGHLVVLVAERKQVVVRFRAELAGDPEVPARSTASRRAETTVGAVSWTVRGGCGCGNPLKRLGTETALRAALAAVGP
jgi:hypothetical protein